MRKMLAVTVLAATVLLPLATRAEDIAARVRKAVQQCTLDQPGTKPFHLEAELAPSLAHDKDSGRTGEVEIWWAGPGKWRREVRSPEFHQIEIVSDGKDWQKNDGDYFPEWLRVLAVALVQPVPNLDRVLPRVKTAEVKTLMGQTNIDWEAIAGENDVVAGGRGYVSLMDKTGLLFYGGGPGWGFLAHDYLDFHGRKVARTVAEGSPEVTATVRVLEDLGPVAMGWYDAGAAGGDVQRLRTVAVRSENMHRVGDQPIVWPALQDGPLEGSVSAEMVIDRQGKIRDLSLVVADNPGVVAAGTQAFAAMRFTPYVLDEVPVQVVVSMSMPFKTVRPAGVESFESARTYFERGTKIAFPAAGPGYVLRAVFKTRGSSGTVETGAYTDTWVSDTQWRREATFGSSRVVRCRSGDKRFRLSEGPDAKLLSLVVAQIEPIPAIDTFTESDWRIRRDTVAGIATIRVARGHENPDGTPDPQQFNGYWFAATGELVKSYGNGLEERRSQIADFNGARVAQQINVLSGGALGLQIKVTEVAPAGTVDAGMFVIKGHDWVRQFTAEAR